MRINAPLMIGFHHGDRIIMAIPTGIGEFNEPFEFDIGDTVQLLWSPSTGLVKGQFRAMNADDQFLVEYVDNNGMLVTQMIYGDCIDHTAAVS